MHISIEKIAYYSHNGSDGNALKKDLEQGYRPIDFKALDSNRYNSKETKILTQLGNSLLGPIDNSDISNNVGVYNCTETGGIEDKLHFDLTSKLRGANKVSPMMAPNTLSNVSASSLGRILNMNGPNFTISGGRLSFINALDTCLNHLKLDRIKYGIVTAVEVGSELCESDRGMKTKTKLPEYGLGFLLKESISAPFLELKKLYTGHCGRQTNTCEYILDKVYQMIEIKNIDVVVLDVAPHKIEKYKQSLFSKAHESIKIVDNMEKLNQPYTSSIPLNILEVFGEEQLEYNAIVRRVVFITESELGGFGITILGINKVYE